VLTTVLAAEGLSVPAESTLLRSSIAAIFAGGAGFAVGVGGAGVGPDSAAGAGAASSVANCNTVCEAIRSSAATGSTLGQETREFILSARRAGRWGFEFLAVIGGCFVLCWALIWPVFACPGLWCSCGGRNPAVCGGGALRSRGAGSKRWHRGS